MIKDKSSRIVLSALFLYHIMFAFISHSFISQKGGDALLYWFKTDSTENKSWFDFFNYGTDAILFINYPLVKWLSIPFFWGFFIYALIGFLGFVQLYRLAVLMINNHKMSSFTKYVLFAFLFLPNTHFWTAMIGKEAIVFATLSTLLLQAYLKKYSSISFLISFLIILVIRPHIAFILVLTLGIVLLFSLKIKFKKKAIYSLITLFLLSISFYMFLQLSKIKRLDWERIQRFNLVSLRSFEKSDSFIPVENYAYPMKLFSFYFRPFFEKTNNLYYLVLSLENFIMLVLTLIGFVLLVKYRKYWLKDDFIKFILLFCLISGLLFTQRYSGLGIFVRTKIMFMPYFGLVVIALIDLYWKEKYSSKCLKK